MTRACAYCDGKPQYRDRKTGKYLCLEHARLGVVTDGRDKQTPALTIHPAAKADYERIEELALYFWDETDVDCFDLQYDVLACPAFLACDGEEVVGLLSFATEPRWNAIVLVLLNVLPDYQGRGAGRALLDALRDEACEQGLKRMIVVTSNDDLPALSLYQRYGFCITGVIPGLIAEEHGGPFPGFAGIMVRDEIRLAYELT